jgi:catechol 2,3-dioxygenase-like lactoylglutathione lyase family enzyme
MNGFFGKVLQVLHLRVVSDLEASKRYYVETLGGSVAREMPGMLVFVELGDANIVLSAPGGPTEDKPSVTFSPTADRNQVSSELIFRVEDVRAAYAALIERGAVFLTPPVTFPWETRCFLRDPDGYLIELTQPADAGASS